MVVTGLLQCMQCRPLRVRLIGTGLWCRLGRLGGAAGDALGLAGWLVWVWVLGRGSRDGFVWVRGDGLLGLVLEHRNSLLDAYPISI